MANQEHLALLRQGPDVWNTWRRRHGDVRPDLCLANLRGLDLGWLDLRRTAFIGADLKGADLFAADLERADFRSANLRSAGLGEARLERTSLGRADLQGALLYGTRLVDLDLSRCKGLGSCVHYGPSVVDHRTLWRSRPLPLAFLRGVGLPDGLIRCLALLPDLAAGGLRSCFLRYSTADQEFAARLHDDLQARGVRCWHAPQDLPPGAVILDAVGEAVRLGEKLLLVLSGPALAGGWVEVEVARSLDAEGDGGEPLLVPLQLDDAVLGTGEAWARRLLDRGGVADFTGWKEHDAYQKALERLLRDLKVEAI
jgi:hypothetical protein